MDEAEQLCDRVAIVEHGRIIEIGPPGELVLRHCPEARVEFTCDGHVQRSAFEGVPGVVSINAVGGRFSLLGTGEDFVSDVIDCLSRSHIRVSAFRTVIPDLEEVFLKLTGHSIRD